MLEQRIQQQFFDSADVKYQAAESLPRPIGEAAGALLGAITGGAKVLVFGAGQAAALAAHMAALLVGRFERERPPLAAVALLAHLDPAKQVQALGHPGDALLVLDAGDGSAAAATVAAAREKDLTVIAITGPAPAGGPSPLKALLGETDVTIAVPHERAVRVLETQLLVLHCLCDAIDVQLLGEQEP